MITSLMNFRDLTGEAVIQARQCVINAEIEAAREKVIHARSLFEAGIHNVVNGSSGIKAAAAHFLVINLSRRAGFWSLGIWMRLSLITFACFLLRVICICLCNSVICDKTMC